MCHSLEQKCLKKLRNYLITCVVYFEGIIKKLLLKLITLHKNYDCSERVLDSTKGLGGLDL